MIGATGFIGRHVVAALLERRHTVVGLHRSKTPPSLASHPRFVSHKTDTAKLKTAEKWREALENVDAIIHCAAPARTPDALLTACADQGVTRFIHIDGAASALEDSLKTSELNWVILRPNLIYARGVFGGPRDGVATLQNLAAGPGAALIPGGGQQSYQPICMEDLVGIICELAEASSFSRRVIEPVGPDVLSLKEIILKLRHWLDIPGQKSFAIPSWLIKGAALASVEQADAEKPQSFKGLYTPAARSMDAALAAQPSTPQEQWSARLALWKPFLTLGLLICWIAATVSALTSFGGVRLDISALGEVASQTWIAIGTSALTGILLLIFARLGPKNE